MKLVYRRKMRFNAKKLLHIQKPTNITRPLTIYKQLIPTLVNVLEKKHVQPLRER